MKDKFGIIGILIAILAIGIAIFQDDFHAKPRPQITEEKSDKSVLKGLAIKAGIRLLRGKEKAKEEPNNVAPKHSQTLFSKGPNDFVKILYMALGFIALILGVLSYIKKEEHRISGMAGALGVIAIAWTYVLYGVVIAVVIYLLANFGDAGI